jgi:hypothetical protein
VPPSFAIITTAVAIYAAVGGWGLLKRGA